MVNDSMLLAAANGHHTDVGLLEPLFYVHLAAIDDVVRFLLTHGLFSFLFYIPGIVKT
jgi:hypothetical protein